MKHGLLVETTHFDVRTRLHGVRAYVFLPLILALSVLVLPGCMKLWPRNSAGPVPETSMQKEVAGLVKMYRQCLQKYEEYPEKAKEHCGVYKDAIQELAPEHKRSIVAELMERLRGGQTQ